MINGVNELYTSDLELQKEPGTAPFPDIKSKGSLIAKHLTKETWDKLCAHQTSTCGFTLEQAIANAVQNDDQHIGVYAGDQDSYNDFAEVFDPLICDYHGLAPGFKHVSCMDTTKVNGTIKSEAPVHSTRIRVARSIEGFGLSPGITKQQRIDVENLMKNAFKNLQEELAGTYYPLTGMDEADR
jgi:hypothetical protein